MLVTFTTSVHADITLFGDVALQFLGWMGHSGTVPGALKAADVPAAIERFKANLASHERAERDREEKAPSSDAREDDDEEEAEMPVSLRHRALPLLSLLEAAAAGEADVMWRKGGR